MEVNSLEYQVLSILREKLSFHRLGVLVREEMFDSQQTKFVYNLIKGFHEENDSENITIRSLRLLLNSSIKQQDIGSFRGVVRRIKINTVKDPGVRERIVKRFAKTQLLKHAVMGAIGALEKGEEADLERVRQKIDEAIGIGAKKVEESYDYFIDPVVRVHGEASEFRLATKISSQLDEALGGGIAVGEVGIFIGPTGIGKTMALVNVGYGAMLQGKKVVHATLEIRPRKVARRYDVRCSGVSFKEIRDDPNLVHRRLRTLQRGGAGLQIKDYTALSCSVTDLRAYLERLRAKGFKFDLVIVDHLDLMYSPRTYKEKRHEYSAIIAGLRRLSNELGIPIWTASQANRKAGQAGKTTLWDIAEDIGKAQWADICITISQSDGDKDEGVAKLQVAKNRSGSTGAQVKVFFDYDTMTIKGGDHSIKGIRRKLRDGG